MEKKMERRLTRNHLTDMHCNYNKLQQKIFSVEQFSFAYNKKKTCNITEYPTSSRQKALMLF